jgi:hypothetical protein
MNDYPFIYSSSEVYPFPLQSYLPEYRSGFIQTWLKDHIAPHSLILTPFSSSPQAILGAAKAGFKVLVPAHNPILRFLLECLAKPVSKEKFKTTLVQLGSSSKAGERIEPLILSLYKTDCPHCAGPTIARSFIWSREQNKPIKKICRCTTCGEDTTGDVDNNDIVKAKKYQENSPSHARALTRVAAPDDPIRLQVEIALRSYPPRSVYALFTLFNKISGLSQGAAEKKYLEMLLLYAFYRSSSPETRLKAEAGEDIDQSDYYIEENIWFLMEDAISVWSWSETDTELRYWPELPPETGGICIFPDRIRELIPLITELPISLILLSFPKPRLSFWALSALWTGWLWGQEAAAPLRNILSIKEYDWTWLSKAVEITLTELRENLPKEIKYLGNLPDLDPEYLVASLISARKAGLDLQDLTIEPELRIGISSWTAQSNISAQKPSKTSREIIREAGINFLMEMGEPAHTLNIYGAGIIDLIKLGALQTVNQEQDLPADIHQTTKDFEENVAYRQGFLYFEESKNWWHQDLDLTSLPHSAQVEMSLVNLLVKNPGSLSEREVYQNIYQAFPGLHTPRDSLIRTLLESYGEKISTNPGMWKLKSSDNPEKRISDLSDIKLILKKMGEDLGFTVEVDQTADNIVHLTWSTEITAHYDFFVSVSGLVNKIIDKHSTSSSNSWIVLPGSRAGLIYYKILHNPILEKKIEDKFSLVKFRHIRRLYEQGGLTHTNIQERLALDPFTSDSPQLQLI